MGWTPQEYRELSADDELTYKILVHEFEKAEAEEAKESKTSTTQYGSNV
jgi:hypothetical protein